MSKNIKRIYVNKKEEFNVESRNLYYSVKSTLNINGLQSINVINRYDIDGIDNDEYEKSKQTIFSEPTVDYIYEEEIPVSQNERVFAVEYLPGQYDQRADSAVQCVQILTQNEDIKINSAKVYVLTGEISDDDYNRIKKFCINSVDSREASLDKPSSLEMNVNDTKEVNIIENFVNYNEEEIESFIKEQGLAMSIEDLKFCKNYFSNIEKRNPTITEIKVIDTYWSDHCRHTTFMTEIENIKIEEGKYSNGIKNAFENYIEARKAIYEDNKKNKPICLMDIAVIGMKELKKKGLLQDLDESDEINACSIVVDADIDGNKEKWLVMFKNETHNHPTEIEPFGGAATCLGGAIRDPLSGRSYVYQAMRVTGSGDPRTKIEDTLEGKLPQKKITLGAAQGYSSYGNQIGLATGLVSELYHEDFIAKRMEVGAVIAAAPKENVVREEPIEGDKILLVGGKTGRDGCGGATGSSKEHDESSILTCGSEVQKGNAPTERKIQRLFRNKNVSKMIKRCNDFGAGGVSVAIGELTDGLDINLDLVPKKYEGLDGTELAISESQERMAVVVSSKDVEDFIKYAKEENIEVTVVADVTNTNRLRMFWRGNSIVDVSRDFLNTNGIRQKTDACINMPEDKKSYFNKNINSDLSVDKLWIENLKKLSVCSQKGLVERFDSTIGAGTVIMPFGGKHQLTPSESMVAKLPVISGDTNTGTIMSYGYNPYISKWSPFHGAVYAVVESVAKIVAAGGDYSKIRLSFQEYFEKLGKDPIKWGKPLSALLGALLVQQNLNIAAIGGKDSMSGTFKDISVPPTLISFAVNAVDVTKVISPEFKKANSKIVLVELEKDEEQLPNFEKLKLNYSRITELINKGKVLSVYTIKDGGIAEAVSKMAFGNKIGVKFVDNKSLINNENLFYPNYGSIILEVNDDVELERAFENVDYKLIGCTQLEEAIVVNDYKISIDDAIKAWNEPLEDIFPTKAGKIDKEILNIEYTKGKYKSSIIKNIKPQVFIPVFPGTNCEYDSKRAFEKAGADTNTFIFRNQSVEDIKESIDNMVDEINKSNIIMFPGGFSAGDEPDGSGKFIATVFRNPKIKEAVMKFLNEKDGLMLGICNGFQALIKLGLVPYGEICDMDESCPTLTYNKIGRHVSQMVNTKVVSNLSPWFSNCKVGDTYTIPVSHGEGRFVASDDEIKKLINNGQIATQYVDLNGNPSYNIDFNPNGSYYAVEGITSPDGRILGKMAHSERKGNKVAINIYGEKEQKIFQAGVDYFKL